MNEAIYAHERAKIREGAQAGIRRIISEVCAKYQLSATELLSQRSSRYVAWPRQEVMWRAKKETGASFPLIGKILGGRDHTTVIHGVRAHERRLSTLSTDCPCPDESLSQSLSATNAA